MSLLVLLVSGAAWSISFSTDGSWGKTYWLNERALESQQGQRLDLAQVQLLQALQEDPQNSRLHLNLGILMAEMNRPEDAVKSFETAAGLAKTAEERFASWFNQGVILGKERKIDEALRAYQRALEVEPHSLEVKKNIELLLQQQQEQDKQQDQKNQQGQQKQEQSGQKDEQDQQGDQKDPQNEKDPKDKSGQYRKNPKPQPKPFQSENLDQGQVNKILGEVRNQEQRIRAEFQRKSRKENTRGKDW